MLYNKNGLSCYLHQVEINSKLNDEKSQLVTGAFTAITSLIQETLGAQAKLERIQARDFQIIFIRLPQDNGTFVVIAHGDTAFFQKSLKRFVSSIKPDLLKLINEDVVEQIELQKQIDAIAKNAFPYVFS